MGKTVGKTEIRIIEMIKNNPTFTREMIAEKLKISVRVVEYYLNKLKESEVIKRKGGRKEGYWEYLKTNE